jgi:hypothetical protein
MVDPPRVLVVEHRLADREIEGKLRFAGESIVP